ncbi:MAG: nitrilase-related carbon-nitrogen hydrolase, partial [Terracidiphilus sp.]
MPRIVRCSIIQASNAVPATEPLDKQKKAMVEKHVGLIRKAAADGAQIVCLQEIFNGPYFCAEQEVKWYQMTEPVPDGPTVKLMQALAKELGIAMVVPVYEVEQEGIFYNTAAVIDKLGAYLGK